MTQSFPTLEAGPRRRRFSTAEYHRLSHAGVLDEDDRVELIRGEIFQMPPIGSRHAACVEQVCESMRASIDKSLMVRSQQPLQLSDDSEPEPDIALVRRRSDFYAAAHPQANEVVLLIEVAESSSHFDRDEKMPLYAENGIPECWLIDLNRDRIEVYTEPVRDQYLQVRVFTPGEVIPCPFVQQTSLAVHELLPARMSSD
ncbi:MAG TPA: Uma2 family endonuclease [Chloroflexota bacterium]|nr:Uma2 family endonuclease [Chloroflexota bacterium]